MLELLLNVGIGGGSIPDSFVPPAILDNTIFKGYVPSANFIDGITLASALGVTTGVAHNSNAGWLKFILADGMVCYVARKTLRYQTSASQLRAAMAGKTVTIGGKVYIARLLTGRAVGSDTTAAGTGGGEWNQLIYSIYAGSRRANFPANTPQWSSYTDNDLGLAAYQQAMFPGAATLTSESVAIGTNSYATRGTTVANPPLGDIIGSYYQDGSIVQIYHGWRPILIEQSTMPVYPFRGEVSGADLITYSALTTLVNLTEGTDNTSWLSDPWLKFIDNGKEFYIAKKAFRGNVKWTTLNSLGLVFGEKVVTIGGKNYKVRLMTGSLDNSTTTGGEWNQYFYPLYNQPGVNNAIYQTTRWANYTNADLGFSTSGNAIGQHTLVQNKRAATNYNTRGWASGGVADQMSGIWYQAGDSTHVGYSWRPVLELIP